MRERNGLIPMVQQLLKEYISQIAYTFLIYVQRILIDSRRPCVPASVSMRYLGFVHLFCSPGLPSPYGPLNPRVEKQSLKSLLQNVNPKNFHYFLEYFQNIY